MGDGGGRDRYMKGKRGEGKHVHRLRHRRITPHIPLSVDLYREGVGQTVCRKGYESATF